LSLTGLNPKSNGLHATILELLGSGRIEDFEVAQRRVIPRRFSVNSTVGTGASTARNSVYSTAGTQSNLPPGQNVGQVSAGDPELIAVFKGPELDRDRPSVPEVSTVGAETAAPRTSTSLATTVAPAVVPLLLHEGFLDKKATKRRLHNSLCLETSVLKKHEHITHSVITYSLSIQSVNFASTLQIFLFSFF